MSKFKSPMEGRRIKPCSQKGTKRIADVAEKKIYYLFSISGLKIFFQRCQPVSRYKCSILKVPILGNCCISPKKFKGQQLEKELALRFT